MGTFPFLFDVAHPLSAAITGNGKSKNLHLTFKDKKHHLDIVGEVTKEKPQRF